MTSRNHPIKVALAGNPNSGKTTLFNALTGSRQKVANYPGVTVDSKKGRYEHNGRMFEVIDLPGTYSLTSFSPEELIARKELMSGDLDVVVVVVDSTNLERNLYLLVQIMEMGANPILCLNMSDEARRAGQSLDVRQMKKLLGFPVIETVASRGSGIDRLRVLIKKHASKGVVEPRLALGDRLEKALEHLSQEVDISCFNIGHLPVRWLLLKLLEEDSHATGWVRNNLDRKDADALLETVDSEKERITTETNKDPALFVADRRYGFISGLLREVRTSPLSLDARVISDRIDEVLCHSFFGYPFFIAMMAGVFWLTFAVGDYPVGWIESAIEALKRNVAALWTAQDAAWFRSLVLDGVLAGVGGVVVFLPNILLLFLGLAFLEDTGYMARAAFLMDNLLHRIGLHGKSFIPMITGFGCTVPGIMATRTLANERDRLTTMLVLPLMSCGARLPIYALLIPAFFPQYKGLMLFLIYFTGIVLAAALAKLLRVTLLSSEDAPFVMELPPYRFPTVKALLTKMWERGWIYIRKAGTIILAVSIIMWVLSSYPRVESFDVDRHLAAGELITQEKIDGIDSALTPGMKAGQTMTEAQIERIRNIEALRHSIAGRIGSFMEPALAPMGFDWRIGTALIGSFTAKEVFVAQMGIVFSMVEPQDPEGEGKGEAGLKGVLKETYSPLTAFCLMLFLLIATPCMATLAITRQESGGWRWPLLQFVGLTVVAYLLATVVYQAGTVISRFLL